MRIIVQLYFIYSEVKFIYLILDVRMNYRYNLTKYLPEQEIIKLDENMFLTEKYFDFGY